ncbi:polyglutamate biosynthesis protein, putative [Talaromyces stipitatus ATCC 10500]|uniref:Polyglutamate biosynthesis protein, putative n=1 Tax=Talaromyces stipitatus (strain ATCC 10500 / CBS 375.48 / QM 6759 / NRRL 1006) TaxID=441959 RepID=B8LT04_TALSN|nr:polyglutamate biosynthesis protein, putative [Talaromyces stipitatus ATCC 10500]EED23000.1 polyglutamate biosynthesis protein, putative [Talaromyces stipitatus ATCC 10500]
MAKEYALNFTGDVMLGRLIDQLYLTHVSNPEDQKHIRVFQARHASRLGFGKYTVSSPWGTVLPLLADEGDLNLINLETSITTHPTPWPDKTFNYRMHPANAVPILAAAKIDFACLANNHTLDFVWTLKHSSSPEQQHRIAIAGAGESTQEAVSPAILELPRSKSQHGVKHGGRPGALSSKDLEERKGKHLIHVYAATDHPRAWSDVPTFHFVDYSEKSREHLRRITSRYSTPVSGSEEASLKILSVHWGPNYRWHPAREIRSMAHFLIFECGIDIIHGHSSHHVQGIECPAPGKLIIYGCGDFVDDYALNKEFRNDLGALYRVIVKEEMGAKKVKPVRLEIFPTKITHFQAYLLRHKGDKDHDWVVDTITRLTNELMRSECDCGYAHDTKKNIFRPSLGDRGQLIIDLV